jgi:DNA-binding NarL/FixJ family response regulator
MEIKVAIIEDQKEIREMLVILIQGSDGFKCVGAFENAEQAIHDIPTLGVDVVLVDIHLPKQNGIECVYKLKQVCSNTQYVMCTSLEDTETIFMALKAGANGYIIKSTPPSKILEAIKEVAAGGSPMSSNIARKVIDFFHTAEKKSNSNLALLSSREQEVITFLSKGFRYKEIAEKLFLSTETIRTHVRNIYEKLQVNSRTEALNKVF